MEGWQENQLDWYNSEIGRGTIKNLGVTYDSPSEFFIIPMWVHDQYGIDSVDDMRRHWDLFRDPEDPFRGVFHNCVIAWRCAQINTIKLEAYGLDQHYNNILAENGSALIDALSEPQENNQPVFGYYWAPASLMGAFDWWILEEPAYTDNCWDQILEARDDASLRPIDTACAYRKSLHREVGMVRSRGVR